MSASPQAVCSTCLAPLSRDATRCPRCGWRVAADSDPFALPDGLAGPLNSSGSREIDRGTGANFGIGTLLLAITLIGVLLGIGVAAPGLGIVLALLAVPPVVRTTMVVRARKLSGRSTDISEKTALFLMSSFVTWVIVFVLVSVCCLTFCGVCVAGLVVNQDQVSLNLLLLLATGVTLVVAVLVLTAFGYWIRARWNRDVSHGRPNE